MSDEKRADPRTSDSERREASDLSRREFVVGVGGAAAAAGLMPLAGCGSSTRDDIATPTSRPLETPASPQSSQDRYRHMWSWDGRVRGTHNTNCAFQTGCSFNIFTRDGVVVREEQAAIYPQTHEGVPDYNPRGCQKGCAYSELMYSTPRLKTPLKRAGERGEGSWTEVSWEEALTDIADRLIDTITEHGPDAVVVDTGTNVMGQTPLASMIRFRDAIDAVILDLNAEIGDDQQGAAVTFGDVGGGRSGDDFFFSDLILSWGGNPVYTQIPDFHFLSEARYHGATVVAISPDLNASATHADLWVPVKPGTDAALAMAMARVVIDENLYDAELIREQTDLPYLVRLDNGKLLRESDLEKDGSLEVLYRYDLSRAQIEAPDVHSLALDGSVPALEGVFEVEGLEGKLQVQPVFEALKKKLAGFSPERASELCGVSPEMIRKLARMLASSKAASNVVNMAMSKAYHGDLMIRTQILVFLLCGHLGKKGAGYLSSGPVFADGHGPLLKDSRMGKELRWRFVRRYALDLAKDFVLGRDSTRTMTGVIADAYTHFDLMTSSTLFWNLHGGMLDLSGRDWDRGLKRSVEDYIREAMQKGWVRVQPAPQKSPKVLISWAGNLMRRVRGSQRLREILWPKLDLIVALELRMSSTAMQADYVLPVASSYEKPNVLVLNTMINNPFIVSSEKAVEAVGNTMDEWELASRLIRKIEGRAAERGVDAFTTRHGNRREFAGMYQAFSQKEELGEKDAEKLSEIVVENSSNLSDLSWKQMKQTGFARSSGVGSNFFNWGQASDIRPDETTTPYTWHTDKKEPWPTLSGRIQFYIDHDWYLEFGEELPTHKPPPLVGGEYPLVMTGGHARWSIHSLQRTDPWMLRLQRGGPCMWVSVEDAGRRGIEDGDRMRVWNDVGSFISRAKISPSVRPGQVIMYHGWENYQFEGETDCRSVQASPLKPIELVGDYPFIRPTFATRHPGMNGRDTRVDIELLPRNLRKAETGLPADTL
jgi:DMSO reductase family type II enzyme molybdopterin subunit